MQQLDDLDQLARPYAEALVEALQGEETYSLVKLTPSHLEVLRQQLTAEQAGRCSRALVIGGEALYEEQVRWWREQTGAVLDG